jgi:hypothetical protein
MIVLLVAVELALVAVCVVSGLAMGRRSHFWARVLLGCLLLPSSVLFLALVAPQQAAVTLAWLILMATFIVVPVLSCQNSEPLPSPSSDGDDGGGPARIGHPRPPSRRAEAFLSRMLTRRPSPKSATPRT